MTEEATKRCSKCGGEKPLAEFYAAKGGLGGRRPECKRCSNSYRNSWARRRYVPKTGRRYRTRRDREAEAAAREPDAAP
jgi:hypothetical protein